MTGARSGLEPRMLTAIQVAAYLGWAETTFHDRLPALSDAGFPKRDPIIAKFDRVLIDKWLDRRGGIGGSENVDREKWKEAARNGRDQNRRRPHGAQKAA
jgi:hypothetical protein